jgi:hypothetical protein
MTTVHDRFTESLTSAQPFDTLRRTVQALVDAGEPTQGTYDQLNTFALEFRAAGRETDEDAILDVMDLLVGFCAPELRIRVPGDRT